MIESEVFKERITQTITHWAQYTKANFMLRKGDVSDLVRQIMDDAYHVTLACGHKVRSSDEGVTLAFKDYDDGDLVTVQGTYCRDCAKEYKRKLGAWEIKNE